MKNQRNTEKLSKMDHPLFKLAQTSLTCRFKTRDSIMSQFRSKPLFYWSFNSRLALGLGLSMLIWLMVLVVT